MLDKIILESIMERGMFAPGDTVVVGLSGGADSVCLLFLLNELKERLGIRLAAVHVHHGLRGSEADRDRDYSKAFSETIGVPFSDTAVDAGGYAKKHSMSLEEAGRLLRYEALEGARNRIGAQWIAVAHHADDQVETVLYNLFRGAGLKGLGGMRPVRGRIVRPLLCVGKEEIVAYLEENGISYCVDSTNASADYVRNRVRNRILPLIREQINEGASENILHAARLALEADEYFEDVAETFFSKQILWRNDEQHGSIREAAGVNASVLLAEKPIVRTYVIRRMLEEMTGTGKDLGFIHISGLEALLGKPVGRQVALPYGLVGVRSYEELWIMRHKAEEHVESRPKKRLPIPVYQTFPSKKGQEIPKNGYTKWFDYDKINHMLSVRYRRTGDYITLAGGGRKTVKAFMIDEKIPRERRDEIALIADGSHIVWIVGYRISEYYKVTDKTETILQIQINGGESDG